MRAMGALALQGASGIAPGYRAATAGTQIGGQVRIASDWFVGASAGTDVSTVRARNMPASTTGRGQSFGTTVKWRPGDWLFAGAVVYSHGSYKMSRAIALPDYAAQATGSHPQNSVTTRLRGAYQFPFDNWYVKPQLDLDANYTWTGSSREAGAGDLGLITDANSQVFFTASPTVEVGGRFVVNDELTLRGYASVGMAATVGEWNPLVRFIGMPTSVGGFRLAAETPRQVGTFNLGMELLGLENGLQFRGEYWLRVAPGYQSHTGSLRMAYRF